MSSSSATETPVIETPGIAMFRTLALVAAISGFLVVLTYQITQPMIEINKRQAIERALFKVIPGAVERRDFRISEQQLVAVNADNQPTQTGILIFAGYDKEGQLAGVALEAAAQGYQDVIRLLFGYDPRCQCIRGIDVLKMAETPGIGDKIAKDKDFLLNFEKLDASLNQDASQLAHEIVAVKHNTKTKPWEIDAITGATISSRAVARMINQSSQKVLPLLNKHLEQLKQPIEIPMPTQGDSP